MVNSSLYAGFITQNAWQTMILLHLLYSLVLIISSQQHTAYMLSVLYAVAHLSIRLSVCLLHLIVAVFASC